MTVEKVLGYSSGEIAEKNITIPFDPLLIAAATGEPTGFEDPANIVPNYDTTLLTYSLSHPSGFVVFWIKGVKYSYPGSVGTPWVVPTVLGGSTPISHINANGTYFLKINTTTLTISFDTTPFNFATDMHIGIAIKGTTYQYGQREHHGLMPWQSHEEDHWNIGSYVRTAAIPTNGTYSPNTTNGTGADANNTPGIDSWTTYDEDLPTVQPAWIQGTYTVAYRNGVGGGWVMSTTESFPFMFSGGTNFIKYNLNTGGTWSLADVPENNFVNILMVSVPVTSSVNSQKYRIICFVGQTFYTTSAAALAAIPANWDFGNLITDNPEMTPLMMWTYIKHGSAPNAETTTGRARLYAEPTKFTGSSRNLLAISGVTPGDHQSLSNRNVAGAHLASAIATDVTWGGSLAADRILSSEADVQTALNKLALFATNTIGGTLSATTQSIAGEKTFVANTTFNAGITVSGGTSNNFISVETGGTAAAGKITRATTTWQLGGTNSTISEAGAANFSTSVNSPLFTFPGALSITATGASGSLTQVAGTTYSLNVGANSTPVSPLNFTALGESTIGVAGASLVHTYDGTTALVLQRFSAVNSHAMLRWKNTTAGSATNNYWGIQPSGTVMSFLSTQDFVTYSTLGSYSYLGAFTFGLTTGNIAHTFQSGGITSLVIKSLGNTTNAEVKFDCLINNNSTAQAWQYGINLTLQDGSIEWYNTTASKLLSSLSTIGKWMLGPTGGLGTGAGAYHKANGSFWAASGNASDRATFFGPLITRLTANVYVDNANALKAVTTDGYTYLQITRPSAASTKLISIVGNLTAQTADAALNTTGEVEVFSITQVGAYVLGNSSVSSACQQNYYSYKTSDYIGHIFTNNASTNISAIRIAGTSVGVNIGISSGSPYFSGIYGTTVGGTNATVLADNNGLLGTVASTRRLKTNIRNLETVSDRLRKLLAVRYDMKDETKGINQLGLIAEDVFDYFPEIVPIDSNGEPCSIRYDLLSVLCLKTIQELDDKIVELEKRIA